MKVLCPSCERLVELVDLRVERGGLIARCPACGAEQRQELPARPVTVPSPKAAAKKETEKKTPGKKGKKAPPPPKQEEEDENDEGPTIILLTPTSDAVPLAVAPAKKGKKAPPMQKQAEDDENEEGPTIILLTPTSDAVPLAIAPPGTAAPPSRPAEVAKFESAAKPPAIAPVAVAPVAAAPLAAPPAPLTPAGPPRRVVDAEFANLLNQLGDVPPPAAPSPQPQVLRPRNTGSTPVIPPSQAGVARGSTIQIPPGHCPKCITPRTPQALICNACGLVFANFRAEEHQPSAALESAWRALEERWGKQEEHDKFLQMAFNMGELAKAGRLYRIHLAGNFDDPQAKTALESMVRMASTAAAAAAKTDPAELQRNRRKVLAVSAVLFFVLPIAALLVNFILKAH
jgi:hypothetical protein